MDNFLEELQTLSKNFESPKLDAVKTKLKKAASEGKTTMSMDGGYDKWIINWLEAQGVTVIQRSDQREGSWLEISWK